MEATMNSMLLKTLVACTAAALLFWHCSPEPVSGGGTEGGNTVSGVFINDGGGVSAKVLLLPSDYNPGAVNQNDSVITSVTSSNGGYSFNHVPQGNYSIEATDSVSGKRSLITGVTVSGADIQIPDDTLRAPGAIMVFLPANADATTGYLYVPGTTIYTRFAGTTGSAVVSAPSVTPLPPICYATTSDPTALVLRYNVRTTPGDTTVVANSGWKYARQLRLNTTASGAGVSQDVAGFPVVIRLTKDNFDFTQPNHDGSDILFSRSDTVRLPCEIERWDAGGGLAEVWVKVDTIYGNDSEQVITMYWGNAAATVQPERGAVFDTADGFQGVWHLGDASEDTVHDATLNRYHGVSPDSALPSDMSGIVGNCREFDGSADFITMPNTATGRLNLQQDGKYSVSAWVMADTFVDLQQTLVSKGKYQYFLWMDSMSWQFWEYQDGAGWEAATQRATIKQWVLLTGVRDGNAQYLYVNGEPADSLSLKFDIYPRNTENDLILGRAHDVADGSFFRGRIDEVRIESTVRRNDWIKLSYMNQRIDDRLVIYK